MKDFYKLNVFIKIVHFSFHDNNKHQMRIDFHDFVVSFDNRQVNSLLFIYRFVGPIVSSSWVSPCPLEFLSNNKHN